MKRLFISLVTLLALNTTAQARVIPSPPELPSRAYVVMDYDSGKILAAHQADLPVEPASLTKMMTSYLVEQALERGTLKEEDLVFVSEHAWCRGTSAESCMYLPLNSQARAIDLLRGIIIQSGNDASKAIAEHLAGSEPAFAEKMNAEAQRLGMRNSQFKNATGMPAPGHQSTARDMALLARAIIHDSPRYYPIYSERSFTYNNIVQGNRNALLYTDPSVDGLKTGHTEAAGYCLVTSAKRGNMRLITAIMGADSMQARADQTRALLNWGFSNHESVTAMAKGAEGGRVPVWFGQARSVGVTVADDVRVVLPRGERDQIQLVTRLNNDIEAPLAAGAAVGELVVRLGNTVLHTQPLVAAEAIPEANFFVRLWHHVLRLFG